MIHVPIVDKRSGQIISLTPDSVQIMDLETFEIFEIPRLSELEIDQKLATGKEVEYWRVLEKNRIVRVKG